MLRIDVVHTTKATLFLLEGDLSGSLVEELRKAWVGARPRETRVTEYVDMNHVTRVDALGLHLLQVMHLAGVHFIATAPYTQSLLEDVVGAVLPALPEDDEATPLKRYRFPIGDLLESTSGMPPLPRS
ncbi:MAG: hypothetical protein MUF01_07155 [Bryobacterales bacterium]|jgi:ABC-type transporter Mla MlaB component|nr:hypothetical protein [Bryobacterales bacterium]